MGNLVMRDLYDYIQYAKRNDVGMHFPFTDHSRFMLHIYDGLTQVNIVRNGSTIINLIFRPEDNDVMVVRVHNEIADYDHPNYYPMNTRIYVNESWMHDVPDVEGLYKDLVDILIPFRRLKLISDNSCYDAIHQVMPEQPINSQ